MCGREGCTRFRYTKDSPICYVSRCAQIKHGKALSKLGCGQVLVQLLQTDKAANFLQTLISMDLTLHSMEVVNRLTALPEMPPDFLHLYISHCLASCAQAKVGALPVPFYGYIFSQLLS